MSPDHRRRLHDAVAQIVDARDRAIAERDRALAANEELVAEVERLAATPATQPQQAEAQPPADGDAPDEQAAVDALAAAQGAPA